MTNDESVDFDVIRRKTKVEMYRRPRRRWGPVVESLRRGKLVFMTDDQIDEASIKYLANFLRRAGFGEALRTRRTVKGGRPGRTLWLGKVTPTVVVEFEELEEQT